jgi:hypothetical protein
MAQREPQEIAPSVKAKATDLAPASANPFQSEVPKGIDPIQVERHAAAKTGIPRIRTRVTNLSPGSATEALAPAPRSPDSEKVGSGEDSQKPASDQGGPSDDALKEAQILEAIGARQ